MSRFKVKTDDDIGYWCEWIRRLILDAGGHHSTANFCAAYFAKALEEMIAEQEGQ